MKTIGPHITNMSLHFLCVSQKFYTLEINAPLFFFLNKAQFLQDHIPVLQFHLIKCICMDNIYSLKVLKKPTTWPLKSNTNSEHTHSKLWGWYTSTIILSNSVKLHLTSTKYSEVWTTAYCFPQTLFIQKSWLPKTCNPNERLQLYLIFSTWYTCSDFLRQVTKIFNKITHL